MRTATAPTHPSPRAGSGDPPDVYSERWACVRVRGAFSPDVIEARPGERLRLVFRREETAACSERVLFPSLGRSTMLPPFEDVPVDLGPLPPGEHKFSCGLGVLRGRILVGGQPAPKSVETAEPEAASATDRALPGRSYAVAETDSSTDSRRQRRPGRMKRPTINITPAERLGRVLVGLVAVIGGLILLGSTGGAVVAVLEVLLILAGLDLIVTGALGHCPLYRKLGHVPASLRRPA